MSIPFTQFLMPDGREISVEIDRPQDIESLAHTLIERGCRFEIERLSTGEISMECLNGECRDGDDLLAGELCQNGPQVPECVDKMIRDASGKLVEGE